VNSWLLPVLAVSTICAGIALLIWGSRTPPSKPAAASVLNPFLKQCCETGNAKWMSVFAGDLYDAYRAWQEKNSTAEPISWADFEVELQAAGFCKGMILVNGNPYYAWLGVRLKQEVAA
jgi:hypothetical protein